MIALEKITEVLRGQEANGIFQVEINPEGYVCSQLENRIEPIHPFTLTVRPIAEERTLRINISMIMSDLPDCSVLGVSSSSTISFGNKCLTVSTKKGIVFELNHVCRDGDDNAPSTQEFEQLLDGMVKFFRQIEMLLLHTKGLTETFMAMLPSISQEFQVPGL